MGGLFVAIVVIIVLVSLFYKNDGNYEKEEKEKAVLAKLKARYSEAVKGGNREQALKAGRDYYAYLRNSRALSKSDEQAMEREVAKMDGDH